MELKVHKNLIFVSILPETQGKIIVPPIFQKAMSTYQRGVVRYCGPKSYVSPGEIIIFEKWAGEQLEVNGERLSVISTTNLTCVE
jgi:co-chaperonin GroES (HSP10)